MIDDAEYAEQRTDLRAETDAGEPAVEAATTDVERSALQGADLPDDVFAKLSQLHAAVVEGLEIAPDLNALRELLLRSFSAVHYLPAGHPWLESSAVQGSGAATSSGAFLLPTINNEMIVGYTNENLTFDADYERAEVTGDWGWLDADDDDDDGLSSAPLISPVSLPIHFRKTASSNSRLIGLAM